MLKVGKWCLHLVCPGGTEFIFSQLCNLGEEPASRYVHTICAHPDTIGSYGDSFAGELILPTNSGQERNHPLGEKFQIPEIMQKLSSCHYTVQRKEVLKLLYIITPLT